MTATASITGYGVVSSPTAGQVIAQTAVLPAGLYEVFCYGGSGGTTGTPESNNVQLTGGTPSTVIPQPSGSGTVAQSTPIRLIVRIADGGAALAISAVINGTTGSAYRWLIVATRIGP